MIRKYTHNDKALIMDLITEKPEALKYVYSSYYNSVNTNVKNNSGQENDSLDVFQESIIVLIRNLKAGKFDGKSNLKSYFMAIARNKWIDEIRKKKRKGEELREMNEDHKLPVSEDDYPSILSERQEQLKMSFAKLKPDCQKVLSAFYYQGQSMIEIAHMLDYTPQFVRVKKNRCMNSLKRMILNG